MLIVPVSTINEWNAGFDDNMQPLGVPENRGKASKVTAKMVGKVIEIARAVKQRGKRLRIKNFSEKLSQEHGLELSSRTVREILTANDLYAPQTRKKRPKYYQSLRHRIPNGLLSMDGSDIIVWLGQEPFKFNVELGVDVGSFAHTAFSIGDTETSAEIIKVLEAHREKWGPPVGMLCDHGSANLSDEVAGYLVTHGIEAVPVGPGNPKGNGTDEGAFSQMKQALGVISLDSSSPRALARSVLEKLICVYISMRNRLPLVLKRSTPEQEIGRPVSEQQRSAELHRLKEHKKARAHSDEDQIKTDRLHGLISWHQLQLNADEVKRAERTIKFYEAEAITAAEKAFVKAIGRKSSRRNLPYFFGILKRIQQESDDALYKKYCREQYNHQVILDLERSRQEEQLGEEQTVKHIVTMLENAATMKSRVIIEQAIRKARDWTEELLKSCRSARSVQAQIADGIGALKQLSHDQKRKAWELAEQFFNLKPKGGSVTLFS